MSEQTRKLVEQAVRGDQDAVEQLLLEHLQGLREFVRHRAGQQLRAREDSSDLVQSTCREVLQHLDRFQYENDAAFRRWLYATALRKILDRARYYQANKRRGGGQAQATSDAASWPREFLQTMITPSREAMSKEELDRVQTAFERLPEDYRQVIVDVRIHGHTHREIAQRLGRSEGAVRVLLSRALARMATLLDEDDDR